MNTYIIKKIADGANIDWDSIAPAEITNYSENDIGYYPKAWAKVCHDGEKFYVKFRAEEDKILGTLRNYNDPVSENSCVEFFVNPYPHVREDYMNFETNCLGALLLGFGYIKPRGRLWHILPEEFGIVTTVKDPADYNGEYWEINGSIPFSIINSVYGAEGLGSGSKMRGNFFTVCAHPDYKHAGTWNPTPGFHDRFGFGELIVE